MQKPLPPQLKRSWSPDPTDTDHSPCLNPSIPSVHSPPHSLLFNCRHPPCAPPASSHADLEPVLPLRTSLSISDSLLLSLLLLTHSFLLPPKHSRAFFAMANNQEKFRDHSPASEEPLDPTEQHMSIGRYVATRFSSLKPPMAKAENPIKLLRMLNLQQWLFFLVAFLAWTWDAFDFFTVSLTVTDLAKTFNKTNTDITWGITLVLMFRSVGSTIFGIAAAPSSVSPQTDTDENGMYSESLRSLSPRY